MGAYGGLRTCKEKCAASAVARPTGLPLLIGLPDGTGCSVQSGWSKEPGGLLLCSGCCLWTVRTHWQLHRGMQPFERRTERCAALSRLKLAVTRPSIGLNSCHRAYDPRVANDGKRRRNSGDTR